MTLHRLDVAMVAGDTSRSRAYLQIMAQAGLLPGHVIILGTPGGPPLPGQLSADKGSELDRTADMQVPSAWHQTVFDRNQPIVDTLRRYQVPFDLLDSADINTEIALTAIQQRPEAVFIYSGFGGVLLKPPILEAGKQFLHVHGGYLPDFKGSTTNYYSLIEDRTMGASAIFLTREIDSGPILLRRTFPAPTVPEDVDHGLDSIARALVLVETLEYFRSTGQWPDAAVKDNAGQTYYIVHPVLKHLAILGNTVSPDGC